MQLILILKKFVYVGVCIKAFIYTFFTVVCYYIYYFYSKRSYRFLQLRTDRAGHESISVLFSTDLSTRILIHRSFFVMCNIGWFKKAQFWGNLLLFDFLNLYVEKKTLAKAVACTMIFNTASAMTNLSLNSQNRWFSCSGIGLLIGFLVFHLIKISFVKPEACTIIFSTASSVNKFMKQRNKKNKKCIRCCSWTTFFLFYLQRRSTKPEICITIYICIKLLKFILKNILINKKLINKILEYWDKKIKTNPPLLYSTLNPETNSDSPSEKSNGVRFNSAINLNKMLIKCLTDPKYFNIPFFCFNIDFLFCYFINLNTGEAILNINTQASGLTKLVFMRWKTRNPMSSPIPEHENSRFWLFRDKFVIVEAVLNIIVRAKSKEQFVTSKSCFF